MTIIQGCSIGVCGGGYTGVACGTFLTTPQVTTHSQVIQLKTKCTDCGAPLSLKETDSGKILKCEYCGAIHAVIK